jgi:hypothetical protein
MDHQRSVWQVQICGQPADLEYLVGQFTAHPIRVFRDEEGGAPAYAYESSEFASCSSATEVASIADRELSVISAVLKFEHSATAPLIRGAVYRRNPSGGRDIFISIKEAVCVAVSEGVTVTRTDEEGQTVTVAPPPPRTVSLVKAALADSAVEKVLRLLAADDSSSWVGLYRIYEVIQQDAGGKMQRWGAKKRELERFAHSANSVAVAGDAARHGRERTQPPKNPMSIEEARALVNYMLHAWLSSKGA